MVPLKVIVFAAFVGAAYASWEDCGSEVGELKSISVSDCDEDDNRCILKRGKNATITISFTSNTDSPVLNAVVHGLLVIPVPFNLPNSNGCTSGVQCPIGNGKTYTYSTSLPVLSSYPKVSLIVKWELQDKDGKDVICGTIPARIQ